MRIMVGLMNLSSSNPLDDNVSYKHLKVFGCRAYVYIPNDARSKLDDKDNSVSYWDIHMMSLGIDYGIQFANKVIRSRYVVFLEDQIVGVD